MKMGLRGKAVIAILPIILAYYLLSGPKFDPETVRGKRVLVTGASSGIGEQVSYKYAKLGAQLVITARRTHLLEKVAKKCKDFGAQSVHYVPADMSLPTDRKKLVEETENHLNGLDYLILNHAILVKYAFWKNTPQNMSYLEEIMKVNFFSYVDITSQLMKLLEKSKGYIGIVSSGAGKAAISGFSQYCASKFALQGFYATLRQELSMRNTGISVTVVVFGAVDTETVAKLMTESAPNFKFKEIAVNAKDAANALVEGVSNRLYEVHFPFTIAVVNWFVALMPEKMEQFIALSTNG